MTIAVKRFAVLGAGNGGQAMAAYLALQGYEVNLYNRSASRIEAVEKEGGIHLEGVYRGFGRLNRVTTDIDEATRGVEILMVVTPAVAHRFLAEKLSHTLQDGQIVILNPGRTGGALEFSNILRLNGCRADVIISEAQTFLFASRISGPARARIFGIKRKVAIAALPSNRTREVVDRLFPVFPQFSPVENVLKTSLDNIGAVFHPAPTIFNMAWIESTGGQFAYYKQGISPSLARLLEEIDRERMAVAAALGIEPMSALDWLRMSYGVRGKTLYELLQNNHHYYGIGAPGGINHRYIEEDIPMSLVPISSLGKAFGSKTPTIDIVIDLGNLIFARDFRESGRTVESLGLSGLTKGEIIHLVNEGYQDRRDILPGEKALPHFKDTNYHPGWNQNLSTQ